MDDRESPESRVVRVFISSTFRDLQAERDRLVKFAFPELRRRCRERQVELVEVDLRWGVTEEQSERGEALPICLAEIERCRPYFIGLLGERYGFVPKAIREELIQTQPWLVEHREHSITELEILHGVLRNPEMAPRAFFYFRDPAYLERVPPEQAADFMPESPEAREKLRALKARIRASGVHLREDYPDPESLGDLVCDDLWQVIDAAYPAGAEPDPLDREAAEHEAFAEARRKVYIGRREYDEALDRHVLGDGPPLVILGASGVGKSALLANWAARHRREHPRDFVLLHFTGSTPYSADYVAILRRIFGEIRRRFDVTEEIPESPEKLREALPTWLAMASARLSVLAGEGGRGEGTAGPITPRFILILDGLNQLEDKDAAPHLGWLPEHFPPNVRLVVSTLPGASLDALTKRGWPSLAVEGIRPEERRTLIRDYLAQSSRALEPRRVERIVAAPQTENPLYLRALLDELRVFGIRHALDRRIAHYLAADTVADLYDKILERWEQDYEAGRPGLVRDALSLLWAARRGLAERELLELLGTEGDPLPGARWAPLALAAEQALVTRSGLIGFAHDYLRQAVQDRFLPSEARQQASHLRLADYFEPREVDARKADELPWQLAAAGAKARLKAVLTDLRMFAALSTEAKKYELAGYWLLLGGRSELEPAYLAALHPYEFSGSPPDELATLIGAVAGFLQLVGGYDSAETLWRRALALCEERLGAEHLQTAVMLEQLAELLELKGNYEQAVPLFRRALAASETIYGSASMEAARVLRKMGTLLQRKGDTAGAEPLYRRALVIQEAVLSPEAPEMAATLTRLAKLLEEKGDYEEAEHLYRRALAIDEKALGPNHPDTITTIHEFSSLVSMKGDFRGAERLLRRAVAGDEAALGQEHPYTATAMLGLAIDLQELGDYTGAETLYRRALEVYGKALGPKHPWTATALFSLGWLLHAKGDYAGAEHLYRRALAVQEEAIGPEHKATAQTLHCLASVLEEKGDYAAAEAACRRALAVEEKVLGPEHPMTAATLHNLASILQSKKDYGSAESLYRRALAVKENILGPEHTETARTIDNLALLMLDKGDYAAAETLGRRALAVEEKVYGPEHPTTALAAHNLAYILVAQGNYGGGEALYRRALEIENRALGPEHPRTVTTLRMLASLLQRKGEDGGTAVMLSRVSAVTEKALGSGTRETRVDRRNVGATRLERMFARIVTGGLGFVSIGIGVWVGIWSSWLIPFVVPFVLLGLFLLLLAVHEIALAVYEKVLGSEHARTAVTLINLAQLLRNAGWRSESEALYGRVLTNGERMLSEAETVVPEILARMAISANELAFHTDVPAQSWPEAEAHYRQAIDLFTRAGNELEARNAELNLQTMFHLAGRPVDLERVRALTHTLEDAGDSRAEKGRKLLAQLGEG